MLSQTTRLFRCTDVRSSAFELTSLCRSLDLRASDLLMTQCGPSRNELKIEHWTPAGGGAETLARGLQEPGSIGPRPSERPWYFP